MSRKKRSASDSVGNPDWDVDALATKQADAKERKANELTIRNPDVRRHQKK